MPCSVVMSSVRSWHASPIRSPENRQIRGYPEAARAIGFAIPIERGIEDQAELLDPEVVAGIACIGLRRGHHEAGRGVAGDEVLPLCPAACAAKVIRLFALPPKSPDLNGAVERAIGAGGSWTEPSAHRSRWIGLPLTLMNPGSARWRLVRHASLAVPNLRLVSYAIQFTFEDRSVA
jgi:hypothetical protein